MEDDTPYIPEELFLHFQSGSKSVIKVNFDPGSKVSLNYVNGEMSLEHNSGLFSVPCFLSDRQVIDTGKCLEIIGSDRVGILGYEGCSGWLNRTQCRFCDSAARRQTERSPVPTLNDIQSVYQGDVEKWLEQSASDFFPKVSKAFANVCDKVLPHCHLHLMSGNLPDLDMTWQYHLDLAKRLNDIKPISECDSYLNLMPPATPDLMARAKELGVRNVIFNMEVWGEKDYKKVCPEKSKLMPIPLFMKRLREAVDIFGKNHVRCGFVFGAQDVELLKEGCRVLSEMGVSCSTTVFTPKRGTPWENRSRPHLDDVWDFSIYLSKLMMKYDLTPLYCRLSSRSEILWELLEDDK